MQGQKWNFGSPRSRFMLVALKTFSCTMLFLFTLSRFRSQEGHTWCGGRSDGLIWESYRHGLTIFGAEAKGRRDVQDSSSRRTQCCCFSSVIYAISMEVAMMFEFLRDLVYILVSDIVFESSYLSVICWRRSESQISIAGAIPSWWVMVNEVLNCPVEFYKNTCGKGRYFQEIWPFQFRPVYWNKGNKSLS